MNYWYSFPAVVVRWLARLAYSTLTGMLLIGCFNLLSPYLGISVPMNLATILVAGLMSLPGLAALAVLQLIL